MAIFSVLLWLQVDQVLSGHQLLHTYHDTMALNPLPCSSSIVKALWD